MIVGIYKIVCSNENIPQILTRVIQSRGGKAIPFENSVITNYVFTSAYPKDIGDKVFTRQCNAWDYAKWRETFESTDNARNCKVS